MRTVDSRRSTVNGWQMLPIVRACLIALACSTASIAWSQDLGTADPDAPTVGASLEKTEAHVGDRLTLTLSAVTKGGIAVRLPTKIDLGKLEVLDRDDGEPLGRDLGDGKRSHRFVLGIAGYETGELEVPPIELSYNNTRGEIRTTQTLPITVHIRALLEEANEKPEAQPLRPPRSALVEDRRVMAVVKYGGIAIGGALVMLLAVYFSRKYRRAPLAVSSVPVIPSRPPEEIALERLSQIRARGAFSTDGYRPFYFEVAEVIRAYLGGRFGFDSLELTTTELIDQLGVHAEHLVAGTTQVTRFLSDTDLVKFAKAGSNEGDALALLAAAEEIVKTTYARSPIVVTPGPSPSQEVGGG